MTFFTFFIMLKCQFCIIAIWNTHLIIHLELCSPLRETVTMLESSLAALVGIGSKDNLSSKSIFACSILVKFQSSSSLNSHKKCSSWNLSNVFPWLSMVDCQFPIDHAKLDPFMWQESLDTSTVTKSSLQIH